MVLLGLYHVLPGRSSYHYRLLSRANWLPWHYFKSISQSVQFSLVTELCPTLCDPMNHSTTGLPVHHKLLEFTQPHAHWVGDAIQSSHPLSSPSRPAPFSSCPQSLQASGSFPMSQPFTWGGQSIGVSASASVLPVNTQDLSPSGWTGLISLLSKGLSRVFSNTTVQKHQFFGAQLSSQSNSQSIHDHWKNHSLDQTDFFWQSNVSAF